MSATSDKLILLTGATGYVGGRLLRALSSSRRAVRCLARFPEHLRARAPTNVEVVQGDVQDAASLRQALAGVHTAYYLVHSLGSRVQDFEAQEAAGAQNFGRAARDMNVQRIIYLGGLGDSRQPLSPHLSSRQQVGNILRQSGVQVVEFRASIVIGSGSLSFELIRALVERLPVMITPKWVSVRAQPIAIRDLLAYLVMAADRNFPGNPIFEIGGADHVSYRDVMLEYARQRGLRRTLIRVPVLSPRLSSLWLGLVTPVYARIRKLVESLRHETLARDDSAARTFGLHPLGIRQAIEEALRHEDQEFAETRWSDALSSSGRLPAWGGVRFGGRLLDLREQKVNVPPATAFGPIERIGGRTGWYYANWLWKIRGFLDLAAGGIGLRRGRPHPARLRVGDALDWWRVEALVPNRRLRLHAEMRLPGRGWLEFEVRETEGGSIIRQTALFDPIGLTGLAYWYAVYPIHHLVFNGMLRGICREAEKTREPG